jgi:signal peptidase I
VGVSPEISKELELKKNEKKDENQVVAFFKTVVLILIAAIMLRGSGIEAFVIPSGSMIPTLRIGDHIFVWKLAYGIRLPWVQKTIIQYGTPERGEILVFTREDDPSTREDESESNIIKRLIGLPGDTVQVQRNVVTVNGKRLKEPYARWEDGGNVEGNFGPEVVPEGHLFMMGDNRDRSKDSRFWNGTHYLPIANVKGRAFLIYWSKDSLSRIGTLIQ